MKQTIGKALRIGLLTGLLAVVLCGSAFALTEGDWEYTLSNNFATVTKYTGSASTVTVPEKLGGAPVTKLSNTFRFNTVAERVTIPSTVTEIGDYSFQGSTVKQVSIPNSVTTIGYSAFDRSSLTSISIPDSVTSIGSTSFCNCPNLTSVRLSNSLTVIPSKAFHMCYALKSITLPEGIQTIGTQALSPTGLTSITIPSSVKTIGVSAFWGCENLTSVTFSSGLEEIGNGAFMDCYSLREVYLPVTLKTIGTDAFDDTSIESLIIPYGVTHASSIDSSAIRAVYVPSTVDFIAAGTSKNCTVYCTAGSSAEKRCTPNVSYLIDPSVDSSVHVLYNGKRISFGATGQNPVIENGRTLVPLRAIFETMGATVGWNDATRTVTATRGSDTIQLTLGDKILYKNGKAVMTMDVPAKSLNGRTVVPARAVAEAFGAQVGWINSARIVTITE